MAKFNGLTLASNSALRALLAGTKTESDRNNAIAAVAHFLQGQPDGFGAHLTAIILAQAQSNQAHAERIEAAVRAFKGGPYLPMRPTAKNCAPPKSSN